MEYYMVWIAFWVGIFFLCQNIFFGSYFLPSSKSPPSKSPPSKSPPSKSPPSKSPPSKSAPSKSPPSKSPASKSANRTSGAKPTQHKRYINILKGFGSSVTGLATHPTSDFVAISSEDRTVAVFDLSHIQTATNYSPPYVRTSLVGDPAISLDFSHSGKHLICARDFSNSLSKLKIARDSDSGKPLQVVSESKVQTHGKKVKWLVSSKGDWVATGSEEDDTEIKFWSTSGDPLTGYDSKQVKNFAFAISPVTGRFVGVAAWAPGIKLMEIVAKDGVLTKVHKAMDLKSRKGMKCLCISPDDTRAITVDKTSELSLWKIDVRYQVSEDPRVLHKATELDPRFSNYSLMKYTPDGKQVLAISGPHIKIFDAQTFEECDVIEFAHEVQIDHLAIAASGHYFVTAGSDHKPRIWSL